MSSVEADIGACIGAGLCTIAANHFDLDTNGKVVVLSHEVEPGDEDLVRDAVSMCPAEALRYFE